MKVGIIGLGRMGLAIAKRLLAQGFDVSVYNRTAARANDVVALGAAFAANPAQLALQGSVVVSSLTDEAAVREVCLGSAGLLCALVGGTHISTSTLSPDAAQRLAAMHQQAGVRFICAPLQGRPVMAENGQLIAWVSGQGSKDEDVQDVLNAFARKTIHLGEDPSQAAAAKLALNMLMFANVELFAEAIAYVSAAGVDQQLFSEGLTETAFAAPLFRSIVATLSQGDDVAKGSDLNLSRKDLALLVSNTMGHYLPMAVKLEQVYSEAADRGWGALDPTAVRRLFQ